MPRKITLEMVQPGDFITLEHGVKPNVTPVKLKVEDGGSNVAVVTLPGFGTRTLHELVAHNNWRITTHTQGKRFDPPRLIVMDCDGDIWKHAEGIGWFCVTDKDNTKAALDDYMPYAEFTRARVHHAK